LNEGVSGQTKILFNLSEADERVKPPNSVTKLNFVPFPLTQTAGSGIVARIFHL